MAAHGVASAVAQLLLLLPLSSSLAVDGDVGETCASAVALQPTDEPFSSLLQLYTAVSPRGSAAQASGDSRGAGEAPAADQSEVFNGRGALLESAEGVVPPLHIQDSDYVQDEPGDVRLVPMAVVRYAARQVQRAHANLGEARGHAQAALRQGVALEEALKAEREQGWAANASSVGELAHLQAAELRRTLLMGTMQHAGRLRKQAEQAVESLTVSRSRPLSVRWQRRVCQPEPAPAAPAAAAPDAPWDSDPFASAGGGAAASSGSSASAGGAVVAASGGSSSMPEGAPASGGGAGNGTADGGNSRAKVSGINAGSANASGPIAGGTRTSRGDASASSSKAFGTHVIGANASADTSGAEDPCQTITGTVNFTWESFEPLRDELEARLSDFVALASEAGELEEASQHALVAASSDAESARQALASLEQKLLEHRRSEANVTELYRKAMSPMQAAFDNVTLVAENSLQSVNASVMKFWGASTITASPTLQSGNTTTTTRSTGSAMVRISRKVFIVVAALLAALLLALLMRLARG